ncbi:MAG TPA: hypothetical protein VFT59_01790 [Candidatus Saccharimonadales bacterium]|nr:hypothetical protein [Candidatus Saccharimonadales bacterium]
MFQSNIPESIGGTDIQLHDYYVAIQWMPREDELQNDVVQETLVLGFMALLQQRSGWPSVEREDFEFDRLQEIARREDRVIEWHFST